MEKNEVKAECANSTNENIDASTKFCPCNTLTTAGLSAIRPESYFEFRLIDQFYTAVARDVVSRNCSRVAILMLDFDDENMSVGLVLGVAANWLKKSVTAVNVQRKSFPHRDGERNDMKVLLAIRCATLTLDI